MWDKDHVHIMNESVVETEELPEPELTHHADSAGISTTVFLGVIVVGFVFLKKKDRRKNKLV